MSWVVLNLAFIPVAWLTLMCISQVEGIVGTYMANQKVPGSRYGASVISYDKGGEWVRLVPPAVDSTGRPTICAPVSLLNMYINSNFIKDCITDYKSINNISILLKYFVIEILP